MNSAARHGESALDGRPHAWQELTCQEYEDAIRADDDAHVHSTITDSDGVYGAPLTFTLWLMSDGTYLSTALEGRRDTPEYQCTHARTSSALRAAQPLTRANLEEIAQNTHGIHMGRAIDSNVRTFISALLDSLADKE